MFYAGNQHYYDFVSFEDTGWAAAKVAAESGMFLGAQGHLATITDAAENAFVASIYHGNAYLGASNLVAGAPTETFQWITGEPFGFARWGIGEPNNARNSVTGENFLMMWHSDGFPRQFAADAPDEWNDIFNFDVTQSISNNSNGYMDGYFVEYEPTTPVPLPTAAFLLAPALGALGFMRHRTA